MIYFIIAMVGLVIALGLSGIHTHVQRIADYLEEIKNKMK